MKNILTLNLFVIISLVSIMSCTKEKAETTLTYSVSNDYVDEDQAIYIWITDKEGEVISEFKLTNNSFRELMIPIGENDRFSLHEFKENPGLDYTYYNLRTFSDIKEKHFHFKNHKTSKPCPLYYKTGNINFSDIPIQDYYILSCGGYYEYGNKLEQSQSIKIPSISNNLYCYIRDTEKGYFKYINGFDQQNSINISIDSFYTDMTLHQIQINDDKFLLSINSFGIENHLIKTELFYSPFPAGPNATKTSEILFHTPNNTNYDNYYTSIVARDINNKEKLFIFFNIGPIPSTFEAIDADIIYDSYTDKNLQIQTHGEYDEFKYSIRSSSEENETYWTYLGASSNNITFPKMPKTIKTLYPEVNKDFFYNSSSKSIHIEVNEYTDKSNYDELIKSKFDPIQNEFYFNFEMKKTVSYYIN